MQSSKAIWALLIAALMHCATGRFVRCGFRGIPPAVASGGRFPASPQLSGATSGRSHPAAEPSCWRCLCQCAVTDGTGLQPSPSRGPGTWKGRLYQRVLSPSIAYILGSQEKYWLAKCILVRPRGGVACANYSSNYYSFSEACFRRRVWHWCVANSDGFGTEKVL